MCIKKISILFLVAVAMVGCTPKETPEVVATDFLVALETMNFEKAKQLGTESTIQMVGLIQSFSQSEGMKEKPDSSQVKIEDMVCDVKDSIAICTYKQNGEEGSIELVKRQEKWLVNLKKEMPNMDGVDTSATEEPSIQDSL